jgi:hypothetical protein
LREKWERLGLVIGNRARALVRRFEKASADLGALRSSTAVSPTRHPRS